MNEVWEACKRDGAGKSMQDYQRSSCNQNGTIPFYNEEWNKLSMPVVFVNGERDRLVPVKHVNEAEKLLPNGKVYILKGCKHWSVKEKPGEFFAIVQENTDHF